MTRRMLLLCVLAGLAAAGRAGIVDFAEIETEVLSAEDIEGVPARIAFGSCGHQDRPMPVLRRVVERQAELFIYLGDNIYGDSRDINVLRHKYSKLANKDEFQALRAAVPTLAIWDDHDYGENDAGKEYPLKEESAELFMEFWHVPAHRPNRSRPGIYDAYRFEDGDHVLQVILLDTRTFRDPLMRNPGGLLTYVFPKQPGSNFKNSYRPDPNPDKTLLGEAQWAWLKERLLEPADVRILCSSIQFGHEYNGYESWTNLPAEQQKMIDLILHTRAEGVIFVSGDVHWAEISRRDVEGGYPLYDVTASGINQDWPSTEPNKYRVGELIPDNHIGMIDIDWEDGGIALQIVDVEGTVRTSHTTSLAELSF